MQSNTLRLGAPVAVLILASGCSHSAEHEPEVMRPASATFLSNDCAVQNLADANCNRELGCGNIGPGRRYETQALCLGTFEREKYEELGFRECLLGVDYLQLDACAQQITAADCRLPLDTLEPLDACGSRELCRD